MAIPDPNRKISSIPGPQDIVRQEMGNSAVILVRENHNTPTVLIDGILRVGAIDTTSEKAGLARFTAAALLRGAGKRSFHQIHQELESVGASLLFSAGQHITEFGGRCLTEDLDMLLDILRDALTAPSFPEEQIRTLRGQIITSLQIRDNDTRHVAGLEFIKLAYPPEHPYSQSLNGEIETVSAITGADILDFYRQHYGPGGMILAVVGDVKAQEIIPKLEQRFQAWDGRRQKAQPELPTVPPLIKVQERSVSMPGKTQSDILLGVAGPPRSAEDFPHARFANTVLGVFGLMGRLGTRLRDEQGLAYYAYSELRGGLGPGPWLVSAGVDPTNVPRAVDCIRDEIRRLQDEPVPPDELNDNKSFLIGSLPLHLETNDGVSGTIVDMELYQLGLDYLHRYPETIREIGAEQVQRVAQKYLSPDLFALAVAGPPQE